MNAKQGVVGGASLDDWIKGADPAAQSASEPQKMPSESVEPKKAGKGAVSAKNPVGRPPVASGELKSKNLQIKLTESEYMSLKEAAGRIPLAVYIRDMMVEKGII